MTDSRAFSQARNDEIGIPTFRLTIRVYLIDMFEDVEYMYLQKRIELACCRAPVVYLLCKPTAAGPKKFRMIEFS